MYREDHSGAGFMLGVMTGAVIGAGVALLLAPKSGQETRQRLGEQYRGLADRVGETRDTLRQKATELREQGRERVQRMSGHEPVSSSVGIGEHSTPGYPTSSSDRIPSSTPGV